MSRVNLFGAEGGFQVSVEIKWDDTRLDVADPADVLAYMKEMTASLIHKVNGGAMPSWPASDPPPTPIPATAVRSDPPPAGGGGAGRSKSRVDALRATRETPRGAAPVSGPEAPRGDLLKPDPEPPAPPPIPWERRPFDPEAARWRAADGFCGPVQSVH